MCLIAMLAGGPHPERTKVFLVCPFATGQGPEHFFLALENLQGQQKKCGGD